MTRAAEELLPLLDLQIELLTRKRSLMGQMARSVREGDLDLLERVALDEAALVADGEALQRSITDARNAVARLVGLPPQEATLGRLADSLDGPIAVALQDRRERLFQIAHELKQEAATVAQIVHQTAELTAQFLAVLVGQDPAARTYSPRGDVAGATDGSTFRHIA